MIIKNNAEFGVELCLAVPYAYWLHKNKLLEKVITSRGMNPFYYFCDSVEESFQYRTIDNAEAGLNELPNDWIYGKAGLGVLDYSKWVLPPYKDQYKNDIFDFNKPIVFISNIFNMEHDHLPFNTFRIEILYEMFDYLTTKGYVVIYKRSSNKGPFTIDQNEAAALTLNLKLQADVEDIGEITDYELTKYFSDVHLFDDIVNQYPALSYNEVQLKLMANTEKFISVCGGNAILSCCFGGTTIIYVTQGRELRPNYFNSDNYFTKLSGSNVIPVFDVIKEINGNTYGHKVNKTGTNDYTELLKAVERTF